MKWNGDEDFTIKRIVLGALIGALVGLFLTAYAAHGQVLGNGTTSAVKSYFGEKFSDWFDQQLMHENTKLFIALIGAISLIGFMAVAAVLHMRTRDSLEKKIEDEANEIKTFQQYVTQRLLEGISDQMKKDVFQTISQGQAALWKPKE